MFQFKGYRDMTSKVYLTLDYILYYRAEKWDNRHIWDTDKTWNTNCGLDKSVTIAGNYTDDKGLDVHNYFRGKGHVTYLQMVQEKMKKRKSKG